MQKMQKNVSSQSIDLSKINFYKSMDGFVFSATDMK